MFRKNYITTFLSIAFLLAASMAAIAQTQPTNGRVELKKADGTVEPVNGATVDVYRADIKGKLPSAKTNKKGEFSFAGLQVGTVFVFAVSAPNIKPEIFPNVKAGQDKIVISVLEGNGERLTEEQVRQSLAAGIKSSGSTGETPKMSEEEKKAQAEYEAKVKEINAKNEKVKQSTAIIQAALKEGNDAFNAKNYDLAIAKYNEGINAEPDFVGSAPILSNNKGTALKNRAVDLYNQMIKSNDPSVKAETMAKVKKDLLDAAATFSRSYEILKNAQPADISNPANHEAAKYQALLGLTDVYRLLVVTKSDTSKATEAKPAYDAYLAVETDPAKKLKAQVTLGDIMREAGLSEEAVAAYRVALETAPDNPEALAGLGLSLFNMGVINSNKEQMQEGLNFMQKFVDVSPVAATDSPYMKELKMSVKDAVEYLKTQEKLTPQKTPKTPKGKGKN